MIYIVVLSKMLLWTFVAAGLAYILLAMSKSLIIFIGQSCTQFYGLFIREFGRDGYPQMLHKSDVYRTLVNICVDYLGGAVEVMKDVRSKEDFEFEVRFENSEERNTASLAKHIGREVPYYRDKLEFVEDEIVSLISRGLIRIQSAYDGLAYLDREPTHPRLVVTILGDRTLI